ncbi:MAG: hypothetical protein WA908_08700 [Pontixanthobacter sp.]
MKAIRASTGWQIILADLSLILFIATAAAIRIEPARVFDRPSIARIEPNFSARMTGDHLHEWLAEYSVDPRERLQIVIDYPPGGLDNAIIDARKVQAMAAEAGHRPRIVLQPNMASNVSASFAFDAPPPLARKLQ